MRDRDRNESDLPEFTGATFDSRLVKPGMVFIALKGEKNDGNAFIPQAIAAGAAKIIGGETALDDLQAFARAYRRSLAPRTTVIALTGSSGKTTTKEFLRAFLSCVGKTYATEGNYNNHLGLPVTILNCPRDADFLILEMGSNHPGEIAALCAIARPDVGLVTNIGTAHLEFFGSTEGIAREKGALLAVLGTDGPARSFGVVPAQTPHLDTLRAACRVDLVEVAPEADWLAAALADVLPGAHNLADASLAFALAARFGVTREQATAALAGFSLPGARWRRRVIDGVTYIDDSYNANPDSMIAALDAFARLPCDGKRVVVLGDMGELGPETDAFHRRVFDHAMRLGFPLVIGVGEKSSRCLCHLAYRTLAPLKKKFRLDVSSGDLVLLKASHAMGLSSLLDRSGVPR